MTEKEILLHMIKNVKNREYFCCGMKCVNCYYFVCAPFREKGFCWGPFKIGKLDTTQENLEQYYIDRFGYDSLIEELL
jgi:hypothetical protein